MRTQSMSATQSIPSVAAMPFGASSVTPSAAPSIHFNSSTSPWGESREMKPLPSDSVGAPLMFETR